MDGGAQSGGADGGGAQGGGAQGSEAQGGGAGGAQGGAGEKRYRPVGEPVDPYAEPLHGAGPYEDPPAGGEDDPAAGEVFHSGETPGSEMQRMRQYRREQDEQTPPKPPPEAVGRYPYEERIPQHPPDTIRQFSSLGGAPPRRRRSDWPVLTFALVVAAAVIILCCLAGFALFSTWNPFKG